MKEELEKKLVERWPTWFHVQSDIQHTLLPLGFEHGDGWFAIVWRLCEQLEPLVARLERETGRPFKVLQVKEKFGGLTSTSSTCLKTTDVQWLALWRPPRSHGIWRFWRASTTTCATTPTTEVFGIRSNGSPEPSSLR